MPNDITKAISANDIRNGSVVCTCPVSGNFVTDNSGDQGEGKTPDQSRDKKTIHLSLKFKINLTRDLMIYNITPLKN